MKQLVFWLAFSLAGPLVLADASAVRAAACPVTLEWFWIGANGSSNGYAQYALQLSTIANDRYTIHFAVVGTGEDMSHALQATVSGARWGLFTFPWHRATLGALTVKDVTLSDGTQIPCADARAIAVLNAPDEVKRAFDDSNVSWPAEVTASPVPLTNMTDAQAIQLVEPVYPALDKNMGHVGSVTVEIAVGPDGRPVAVTVVKSSGYSSLDNAALDAARKNRYKPPTVDGVPNVQEYLTNYVFNLR